MNITISKKLALVFADNLNAVISTIPVVGEKMKAKGNFLDDINEAFAKDQVLLDSKTVTSVTSNDTLILSLNEDYIIECLGMYRNAYTMANAVVPSLVHIGEYLKGAQKALDEKWHPDTKVEEKPEQYNNRRYDNSTSLDDDDIF